MWNYKEAKHEKIAEIDKMNGPEEENRAKKEGIRVKAGIWGYRMLNQCKEMRRTA